MIHKFDRLVRAHDRFSTRIGEVFLRSIKRNADIARTIETSKPLFETAKNVLTAGIFTYLFFDQAQQRWSGYPVTVVFAGIVMIPFILGMWISVLLCIAAMVQDTVESLWAMASRAAGGNERLENIRTRLMQNSLARALHSCVVGFVVVCIWLFLIYMAVIGGKK